MSTSTAQPATSYLSTRSDSPGLRLLDRDAARKAFYIWLQNAVTAISAYNPDAAVILRNVTFPVEFEGKKHPDAFLKAVTSLSPTFHHAMVFVTEDGAEFEVGRIQLVSFPADGSVTPLDWDDDEELERD